MKALELVVYPKARLSGYVVPLHVWSPSSCGPEDMYQVTVSENDVYERIESKRLTDAELAAEYHAANAIFQRNIWQEMSRGEDWPDETWTRIAEPVNTLHRFATLPHYDAPTETGTQA